LASAWGITDEKEEYRAHEDKEVDPWGDNKDEDYNHRISATEPPERQKSSVHPVFRGEVDGWEDINHGAPKRSGTYYANNDPFGRGPVKTSDPYNPYNKRSGPYDDAYSYE
jgi:hypothetical protein